MEKFQKLLLILVVSGSFLVGCQDELNEPDQGAALSDKSDGATLLPMAQLTLQDLQLIAFTKSLARAC